MNISPKVEQLPDTHVAYVSFKGDYRGKSEVFANLFRKLAAWAGPKGLMDEKTVMISSYNNDPMVTPPEELLLDVCMTAPENVEVEGDIQKKVLPGGKYVVASFELTGPQEYEEAWGALVKWIADNDLLEMDTKERAWYEVYKNDPKTHPKGHYLLDMCAAVK
jgi:AraC family transcriptional regulator